MLCRCKLVENAIANTLYNHNKVAVFFLISHSLYGPTCVNKTIRSTFSVIMDAKCCAFYVIWLWTPLSWHTVMWLDSPDTT